ncbi:MAG: alpha/beta hydrolase [Ilumatobacteraceae bacterium]
MTRPGMDSYNEFGLFGENITEYGIDASAAPHVRRVNVEMEDGRNLSALVWGSGDPRLVLIHGGAQNAHTWDTVALALGVPLVAIDLAGHGHSDWREDAIYSHDNLAKDVVTAIERLAPNARAVVGMSLGGLTALSVAHRAPQLVRHLVLIDITPGVNAKKAKAVLDFVNGPQSFDSFDDLLARTQEHNPTRSESSLRRGILHNAVQLDDGSWQWRYDRGNHARSSVVDDPNSNGFAELWEAISELKCPILVVRGGLSPVVDDDDVAEVKRRKASADIVVIENAGHSIQGDRPIELAELLRRLA